MTGWYKADGLCQTTETLKSDQTRPDKSTSFSQTLMLIQIGQAYCLLGINS